MNGDDPDLLRAAIDALRAKLAAPAPGVVFTPRWRVPQPARQWWQVEALWPSGAVMLFGVYAGDDEAALNAAWERLSELDAPAQLVTVTRVALSRRVPPLPKRIPGGSGAVSGLGGAAL